LPCHVRPLAHQQELFRLEATKAGIACQIFPEHRVHTDKGARRIVSSSYLPPLMTTSTGMYVPMRGISSIPRIRSVANAT
jgi:hypothetical protein